jgi:phosphate acyltransferase
MATGPKFASATAPVPASERIVISVDAMGGDLGPAAVVAGLADSMAQHPQMDAILHGDEAVLAPLLARHAILANRCTLRHAARVVTMEDKPAQVMRHGTGTSMWGTIDSVKDGEHRQRCPAAIPAR